MSSRKNPPPMPASEIALKMHNHLQQSHFCKSQQPLTSVSHSPHHFSTIINIPNGKLRSSHFSAKCGSILRKRGSATGNIVIYKKYISGRSDDQNILLIYIWSSSTVPGSQLLKL